MHIFYTGLFTSETVGYVVIIMAYDDIKKFFWSERIMTSISNVIIFNQGNVVKIPKGL